MVECCHMLLFDHCNLKPGNVHYLLVYSTIPLWKQPVMWGVFKLSEGASNTYTAMSYLIIEIEHLIVSPGSVQILLSDESYL